MDVVSQALIILIIWFPFFVAVGTFAVGLVALSSAPRSRVVRIFAVFSLLHSYLAFLEWGYRQAATIERAQLWLDAGALWPLAVSAIWSFGWIISVEEWRPELGWMRLIMYPFGAFFTVLGFLSPDFTRPAVERWWGYSYSLPGEGLIQLALLWASVTSLAVAVLVIIASRRNRGLDRRMHRAFLQAVLIVIAGNLLQAIVQEVSTLPIPEFSTVGTGLFVILTGIAVARRGIWEFAPSSAAGTVLETMGDAVILVDAQGMIRYANSAAAETLEMGTQLVGRPAMQLLPPNLLVRDAVGTRFETQLDTKTGRTRHVSARIEAMPVLSGGRVIALRDAEEQMRYQSELSHLAFHDGLTGLGNRALFFKHLTQLCEAVGGNAACLIIDLDRFKEINDAYGHAVGDTVLVETASRIVQVSRSVDHAYRLGGDEFALLLRDLRDPRDARIVAEKLIAAFEQTFAVQTLRLSAPASIGFTGVVAGDEPESVFARSDAGLFKAKARRGVAVQFSSTEELPQTRRALIHHRVRQIVPANRLRFVYQPIVHSDGSIAGAEVLARWPEDDPPPLSPDQFVAAAEETDVIGLLGEQARTHAIELIAAFEYDQFFVSVNLSPRELISASLLELLLDQFRRFEAFGRLHLELTETQLMEFGPTQHRFFSALAEAGVRILIDDFGTGYSSITRLRELPVHGVKLDRSFLRDAHHDGRVRGVVEGTARMVQGLGLELIAEGVESQEHVDLLAAAGCTLYQGFHFHRPMSREDLLKQLS